MLPLMIGAVLYGEHNFLILVGHNADPKSTNSIFFWQIVTFCHNFEIVTSDPSYAPPKQESYVLLIKLHRSLVATS